MDYDQIDTCPVYALETDYTPSQGYAYVTHVQKSGGLVQVLLLQDYAPLGERGDHSWINPSDLVKKHK